MKTFIVYLAFSAALATDGLASGTITFETYDLLGSYRSDGLYNLAGLGTWNGQPVSEANRPSDYERQLATTVNFFAKPTAPNVLFVQVTDVAATHFGSAFGTAFFNITQTGLRFKIPVLGGTDLGLPSLSLDFANPGETRVFTPPDYSSEPLTTTPGFGLSQLGQSQLLISTLNGADYGFINNGWGVYGGSANRIEGGGVFQMTFFGGIDLFRDLDFTSAIVESEYGRGSQYIIATLVPEPSPFTLACLGAAALTIYRRSASTFRRTAICP